MPPPNHNAAGLETQVQFSRRALCIFAILLVVPWLIVVLWFAFPQLNVRSTATAGSPSADNEYIFNARPGPWGDLLFSRILIEPPDEFAEPAIDDQPLAPWTFPGYSEEMLAALWRESGLPPEQIATLAHATSATADALVVQPPPEVVMTMNAATRARIYSVLSQWEINLAQAEPFRFRADSEDEWFADSRLSPATLALVKPLLYRRGNSLLFSDYAYLQRLVPSREERRFILKTLARKATLLVRLRLSPSSDVATIARYWERGPRRKAIAALLESVSNRPQGLTIDIAHLLPQFARAHLFTYPAPAAPGVNANRDCHWSSLNFFNDDPDERFADTGFVKRTLENDYRPVTDRPLLGDVLVFTRPDGGVIHSCVYVADDIVFTKNGGSEAMPWILMNLADVVAFYPSDPALTIQAYRRQDLPP
ncbi:MAG TPA: hypothetical protein VNR00_06260 [Opitutus sp.]|nr:hypothetical protein [Opitutus sp.]